MFEEDSGWENAYLVSIYNLFINFVNFSGKLSLQIAYFWSLVFWWKFKIRECSGA